MKIYLVGDDAFVDLGQGYLVCIGDKETVLKADENLLAALIWHAMAKSHQKVTGQNVFRTLH